MSTVSVQVRRHMATLTLSKPERRNALDEQMLKELSAGFEELSTDTSVRVVVVAAEGPFFCAGADLRSVRSAPAAFGQRLIDVAETMRAYPKPVVVRCNGGALAGGMGLLGAADVVIADAGAKFGFPETKIGVVPAIVAVVLAERMDVADCQRYLLSGETFGAEEARRIGIVSEVVNASGLDEAVGKIVDAFRATSPLAVSETKAVLRHMRQLPSAGAMRLAAGVSARMFASSEAAEGAASVFEKRPAAWALVEEGSL